MTLFLGHRESCDQPLHVLRALEAILNNLRFHTEMPCFIIPNDKSGQWIALNLDLRHIKIREYEERFGKTLEREKYNEENFNRLVRTHRPVRACFSGFNDWFVPVIRSGKCVAFINSGMFLREIPTRQDLERQWMSWTGQVPVPEDPDFKRFALNALQMPLLDGPQAKAHMELLKMAASLIAGEGDPVGIANRATRLNHEVFTKWKLHVRWPRKVLGSDLPVSAPVWPKQRLEEVDRLITGMNRIPTVAMTLLLVDRYGAYLDEVDALIRQKRLEQAGFAWGQQMGEAVAFPLREEGLVFLTSPSPGAKPVQARLQLREKAQSIIERARKLFGVRVFVGIGPFVPTGDSLSSSCQKAFLALHWAIHRDREVLFHDETTLRDASSREDDKPWPEAKTLVESCLRGSKVEKTTTIDQYIQDVLRHTAERPDWVRIHLVSALSLFAVELERKKLMPAGKISRFLNDWILRLEAIRTTHELIHSFKEALRAFTDILRDPAAAEMEATARDLKSYIEEHFRSPLTVEKVARQMGISRSTLHRYVRKWLEVSFNDYLRDVRLAEAKRLLRGGPYGVARIAQECGFSSSGYFIRVFKKATGQTPQHYRCGSEV